MIGQLKCLIHGHDYPENGMISQQCRRCGKWWQYYRPRDPL